VEGVPSGTRDPGRPAHHHRRRPPTRRPPPSHRSNHPRQLACALIEPSRAVWAGHRARVAASGADGGVGRGRSGHGHGAAAGLPHPAVPRWAAAVAPV